MGKAQKKRANNLKKQIISYRENKDFQEMIAAMEPYKSYTLKKGDKPLFEGKSFPGSYWKSIFLNPKVEADGTA